MTYDPIGDRTGPYICGATRLSPLKLLKYFTHGYLIPRPGRRLSFPIQNQWSLVVDWPTLAPTFRRHHDFFSDAIFESTCPTPNRKHHSPVYLEASPLRLWRIHNSFLLAFVPSFCLNANAFMHLLDLLAAFLTSVTLSQLSCKSFPLPLCTHSSLFSPLFSLCFFSLLSLMLYPVSLYGWHFYY